MKRILLLSTLALALSSCYAQKNILPGIQRVNSKKFEIKISEFKAKKNKSTITVFNADYEYNYKAPPLPKVKFPYPMQMKDIHMDNDKIKSIIFNVLSYKLKILKEHSETLSLSFSLDQKGEVKNIIYSLDQLTSISVEDISKIDEEIKRQVKASFNGTDYLQYSIIHSKMLLISL